jgi:hypothetical protein
MRIPLSIAACSTALLAMALSAVGSHEGVAAVMGEGAPVASGDAQGPADAGVRDTKDASLAPEEVGAEPEARSDASEPGIYDGLEAMASREDPKNDRDASATEAVPPTLDGSSPLEASTSEAGAAWDLQASGRTEPVAAVLPSTAGQGSSAGAGERTAHPRRLPIFGLGADVGVPDGANLSLVASPVPWVRFQLGFGSNGIGRGFRVGATLLPFRDGPSVAAEYGHYQDGNANALIARLAGEGFQTSPLLERVGYDYFNLHFGLNFGYQRAVFFVQGGLSIVRGQIHNVAPFVHDETSSPDGTGAGSTEVVVRADPRLKATGIAGKLGLIVYVW